MLIHHGTTTSTREINYGPSEKSTMNILKATVTTVGFENTSFYMVRSMFASVDISQNRSDELKGNKVF